MALPHPKPVFIVGSGRSGTTLAASLINRFADVHIAKETGYISRAIGLLEKFDIGSSVEELVKLTNSWLEVEGWQNRASAQGFRAFQSQSGLSGAVAFIHYVWQLDSRRSWSSLNFIGDNTPGYIWAIPKLESLVENAHYIHMVRDPRDVAASMISMKFGANDALTAALDWQANIGAWMAAERIVPSNRRMELRYEDLCRDPHGSLSRVAAFLGQGVEAVDKALSSTVSVDDEFAVAAGKSHHGMLTAQLTSARIGTFRTRLSEHEIRSVESVTQHLMPGFGYVSGYWHLSPQMEDQRVQLAIAYAKDVAGKAKRWFRSKISNT